MSHRCAFDQCKRSFEMWTVPTDGVRGLVGVNRLPVCFRIHESALRLPAMILRFYARTARNQTSWSSRLCKSGITMWSEMLHGQLSRSKSGSALQCRARRTTMGASTPNRSYQMRLPTLTGADIKHLRGCGSRIEEAQLSGR